MRAWRPAAAALIVAGGLWLAYEARQQAAERPSLPQPAAPATGPEAPAPAGSAAPRLTRDPFRYAEAPREVRPVRAGQPTPAPEATPTPEPAVRLTGFLRSGGTLRAVLVRGGVVTVAAAGDSLDGYRVLSVDEDAGVRLKTPAGEELLLAPGNR